MIDADIKFKNLDEFIKNIKEVERIFPDLSEKYLRRVGNTLKRKAIAASPRGKAPLFVFKKGQLKTNKSKLYLSWTAQLKKSTWHSDLEYQLRSKAPHFHLVERGHEHYFFGQYRGFLKGKFFFKNEVERFERSDEFRQQMEKFLNEVNAKITKMMNVR